MTGKSTVSEIIASKLRWHCISTDDIGEILQTASDMDPMCGLSYLDYYSNTEKNKLIEDVKISHYRFSFCPERKMQTIWQTLFCRSLALYKILYK